MITEIFSAAEKASAKARLRAIKDLDAAAIQLSQVCRLVLDQKHGWRTALDHLRCDQTEGAADRRAAATQYSDRSRESYLPGKEGCATRHAESATPAGSVSEPRVLQSSGDAAVDLRQAARDCMRPGIRPAHRCASWMSDGDVGSSRGTQDPARSSGRTVRGHSH